MFFIPLSCYSVANKLKNNNQQITPSKNQADKTQKEKKSKSNFNSKIKKNVLFVSHRKK